MLKVLTPAKTKKKLRMPILKFRSRGLPRPEATAPFLLLDPAPLKPTSLLLQLHLLAALLLLLPLRLCITEKL
jgi:hypothetical protein